MSIEKIDAHGDDGATNQTSGGGQASDPKEASSSEQKGLAAVIAEVVCGSICSTLSGVFFSTDHKGLGIVLIYFSLASFSAAICTAIVKKHPAFKLKTWIAYFAVMLPVAAGFFVWAVDESRPAPTARLRLCILGVDPSKGLVRLTNEFLFAKNLDGQNPLAAMVTVPCSGPLQSATVKLFLENESPSISAKACSVLLTLPTNPPCNYETGWKDALYRAYLTGTASETNMLPKAWEGTSAILPGNGTSLPSLTWEKTPLPEYGIPCFVMMRAEGAPTVALLFAFRFKPTNELQAPLAERILQSK